jgi:hypothetical protein
MPGKFKCEACAREHTWKAAMAGKRAKCKCGATVTVPADDPEVLDAFEPLDLGAYDVVEPAIPAPKSAMSPITPLAYARPSAVAARPGQARCQVCGASAPTKYVEFHQNVGMLVLRRRRCIRGNLCRSCINEHFWKMTSITLAVGWLGTISLVIAPIFVVNNVVRYLGCLSLPSGGKRP